MNAAARLVHQGILSRQLILIHGLTRLKVALLFFTLTLAMSALGIIYITQVHRVLYADYQRTLIEQDRLSVRYSQLLLEKSAWMMQSRIEQEAENQLGMTYPTRKQTVIIHE